MPAVSIRVSKWVWHHSASTGAARIVHLALADAAICKNSVCKSDAECVCAVVGTRPISRARLIDLTLASRTAVKKALRELIDAGLVVRWAGGYGTTHSRYELRLLKPPADCPCWFCGKYRIEDDTDALDGAGVTFRPPNGSTPIGGHIPTLGGHIPTPSGSHSDPLKKKDIKKENREWQVEQVREAQKLVNIPGHQRNA